MEHQETRAKIIPASKSLQIKAGYGKIDATLIMKAEDEILLNKEDFLSVVGVFLDRLQDGVNKARENNTDMKQILDGLSQPVMELKANARMFQYHLVTDLANIMLGFVEHIEHADKMAIDIIDAHHKTLLAIVTKKMTGDGGEYGNMLKQELNDAIARYYKSKVTQA